MLAEAEDSSHHPLSSFPVGTATDPSIVSFFFGQVAPDDQGIAFALVHVHRNATRSLPPSLPMTLRSRSRRAIFRRRSRHECVSSVITFEGNKERPSNISSLGDTNSPPAIVLVQPVSQRLVLAGRSRSIVIPPRMLRQARGRGSHLPVSDSYSTRSAISGASIIGTLSSPAYPERSERSERFVNYAVGSVP